MSGYDEFLKTKERAVTNTGFEISDGDINPLLFQWQRDVVRWALLKGRAAIFADCGLGKTPIQLEFARHVNAHERRPVLVLAPLAVSEQTKREGDKFGIDVHVCRSQTDVMDGVNITNYEMLEHFDPSAFCGIVLDESSILKHHDSKTRALITEAFRDTRYKLACTATPAPNDYMELCNHSEFLNAMNRVEMLATFFVHDGGDTSKWRLKGHAEDEFWRWMSGWAMTITMPSDIGYPNDGFALPELRVHEITVDSEVGDTIDGQIALIPTIAQTLNDRRKARRDSMTDRCEAAAMIANTDDQCLVWCDLNAESGTLTSMIDGAVEVKGSDPTRHKVDAMMGFAAGTVRCMVTKPSIAGWGMNWQNCNRMVFVGLSDSYEMFYQAVRRCWRFGQTKPVDVYVITSDAEGAVKANIERKDANSRNMMAQMTRYARQSLEVVVARNRDERDEYKPGIEMILPLWIGGAA
jgi:superfamily II DNA or RNA helicase